MRIVLDTCILIAALITKNTPPDFIYQAWRKKKFELITSEWQLAEFRRVSRYQKLREYLTPSEAANMINGVKNQAVILTDLPILEISPDPNDNPILAMAVASNADYLISGDKRDLLTLKKIEKTRILTPQQFLNKL